ncbi:MAG TPA: glycosyltransferase family 39 protein [Gaiellaceae bacterium]|nr:glycosyltransferase family 39 protein [Gaiellaceae bacterium]
MRLPAFSSRGRSPGILAWQYRTLPSWPVQSGVTATLITFAAYVVGAGRAYDYDSSETVGTFVATRSLLDPFRRQLQFNNHPLFSFLDHLVYSLGGRGELALRVLPIAFAAVTVGVVTGWAARRWGGVAGWTAGLVLALNPSYAVLGRSVRGYSLLTLAAVVSSLLLIELLDRDRPRLWPVYAFALAVAVATHLYALFVLVGHLAFAASRGRLDRRLLRWCALGLALGLSAYSLLARQMVGTALHEPGRFQPLFPERTAVALLGTSQTAIVLLASLLVVGSSMVSTRGLLSVVAALSLTLGVVWLVVTPRDLYPRFLVWLVPAVAILVGAATGRSRLALPLALFAAIAMARVDIPRWTLNPLPSEQAADLVTDTRALGDRPCVLPEVRGALMAYTATPPEATKLRELRGCDLSIGVPFDGRALLAAARTTFPYHWRLGAETPYLVYSRLSKRAIG